MIENPWLGNDGYYFSTLDGRHIGPYYTEREALQALLAHEFECIAWKTMREHRKNK